ncbi:membrane-associated progesterone receptor component 1-like [Glandiceps talaboti]
MAAQEEATQHSSEDTENIETPGFLTELVSSPLNLILLAVCIYLLYKILAREKREETPPRPPPLPKMKKRDFTLEEIKEYSGEEDKQGGRILVAVNGRVFDVTRGKKFYGKDGPYGAFGGRDASRALATFSLDGDALRDEYDDLSDLNAMQMESIREWEMQFEEKYDYVGKLLRPGEEPSEYSDEEQSEQSETEKKDI